MDFDTIIIGAGAAGMMCGAQAPGRCLIIDHAKRAGEKIRISGGGRCNFTNMDCGAENYISANPHFIKSALSRYSQWDFIDWVARSGIAYHEKTLGQLFCDNSAKDIIAMLVDACTGAGARFALGCSVTQIEQAEDGFLVSTETGEKQQSLRCRHLVLATGGKPIPKMGATDFALRIARQFGIPVRDTRAGLVPFTFSGPLLEFSKSLAGVALPVAVSSGNMTFREAGLFTHRGFSGPANLQISSYWAEGSSLNINLLPDQKLSDALLDMRRDAPKRSVTKALSHILPDRLAIAHFPRLDKNLSDLSKSDFAELDALCHNWTITPAGTEGYRTAEVMIGGVDTDALDARSMQVKSIPGLYFIGEAVDVTGWLGGYNFQWAWSSGWVAGQDIRDRVAG